MAYEEDSSDDEADLRVSHLPHLAGRVQHHVGRRTVQLLDLEIDLGVETK